MRVSGVNGAHMAPYWGLLRPYFSEFSRSCETPEELRRQVEETSLQCWIVHDHILRAVALTQIGDDRDVKVCRITHLAGQEMTLWGDAFLEIERWARSLGCGRIEATGRPGWERIGKKYGLQKTHVTLGKDLLDAAGQYDSRQQQ